MWKLPWELIFTFFWWHWHCQKELCWKWPQSVDSNVNVNWKRKSLIFLIFSHPCVHQHCCQLCKVLHSPECLSIPVFVYNRLKVLVIYSLIFEGQIMHINEISSKYSVSLNHNCAVILPLLTIMASTTSYLFSTFHFSALATRGRDLTTSTNFNIWFCLKLKKDSPQNEFGCNHRWNGPLFGKCLASGLQQLSCGKMIH